MYRTACWVFNRMSNRTASGGSSSEESVAAHGGSAGVAMSVMAQPTRVVHEEWWLRVSLGCSKESSKRR